MGRNPVPKSQPRTINIINNVVMDESDVISNLKQRIRELEKENAELKGETQDSTPVSAPLFKLKLNPVIENEPDDLDDPPETTDVSDELSGRIIYALNEIEKTWDGKSQEISFYCGPETKDGYILDHADCGLYPQLEELLTSSGFEVSVGESENLHSILIPPFADSSYIWAKISLILEQAGAVRMKTK